MIPINKPWIGEDEKREVLSVLEENSLTTAAKEGGKRVQEFERLMRDFLKVKYVISVNSGTSALHAALLAADIHNGDEVLLPSFTFVATANSVLAVGAKPVFVDINKTDYTIDVENLRKKITNKTKAIIPVHLYGHPSNMDELLETARNNSLQLIEDACQSLGSAYKNKQTGTFGTMGCFSMYASKVLTAGEGGAIVTDDYDIAEKLKMIRNHGMVEGYDTKIFGLNLRLPELSAAIAKIQMHKITQIFQRRRHNSKLMTELLDTISTNNVILPRESQDKKYNWYLYTICLSNNKLRNLLKDTLNHYGIGAAVYYNPPVHLTPYYQSKFPSSELPNTIWAADRVLSLPIHPLVTEEQITDISKIVKEVITKHQ